MLLLLLILFQVIESPQYKRVGGSVNQLRPALYAAVYINKGSTSVGSLSSIGLFRRYEGDTAWVNLRPNTITPGMGFTSFGDRHQLYLAGGNGLHRSTDEGRTWRVLTGWRTKEVLSVALDPADSLRLYISTPFGVYRSTDGGSTWIEKMRGFKTWFVRRVILDRVNRNMLYATGEDALYRSMDGAETWKQLSIGVPGIKWVMQHPADSNLLLVGTEDHGVRYSTDRGETWKQAAGLDTSAVYTLASTRDGSALYAAGFQTGVWRSMDKGATWSQVWKAPDFDAIYSVCVNPRNPEHLMAGTNGSGVSESFDNGRLWHDAGLPNAIVRQVVMYP
ncbi:MAG: hypothetical protein HYZ01_03650 [Ignavibacteriales bacterium]|nr:hypothetical protein [Ignavibacteriales bacterium]